MKAHRQRKLLTIIAVITGLLMAVLLVMYALRQNISLFYTPEQVSAQQVPKSVVVRLGGMVEKGSVKHAKTTLDTSFVLTDFKAKVTVHYHGVLPTLFREGQGIVARGQLSNQGTFIAEEVLAKHDENYMPPEVKAALKQKAQMAIKGEQNVR